MKNRKEFKMVIGEFVNNFEGCIDEINYHFLIKFVDSISSKMYASMFVNEISEVVVQFFKRLYTNIPDFNGTTLDSLRKYLEYYYSIQPEMSLQEKMRNKPHDYAYQLVNKLLELLNENILPNRILSLDVESNGLWGKPISIGFTIEENGKVIEKKEACCLNDLDNASDWVKENVIDPLKNRQDIPQIDLKKLKKEIYKVYKELGEVSKKNFIETLKEKELPSISTVFKAFGVTNLRELYKKLNQE